MFSPTFDKPITFKTVVQLVYNLAQTSGWLYIAYLLISNLPYRLDSFNSDVLATKTFPTVGKQVVFQCQLAFVEILLALFHIIPSNVTVVISQLIARNIVILVTVNRHLIVQQHVAVFIFILAWTLTEIVRFPWLIFKTLGQPPAILTYIRYASPIVLYPLGGIGEFWSMYNAQSVGEKDILFTVMEYNFTLQNLIHYVYFPLFFPFFCICT